MRPEIVEKVRSLIQQPAMTESQVVHLFALTRKLIEDIPTAARQKYALLRFYCDWSLHKGISRSSEGADLVIRLHSIVRDHVAKSDNSDFFIADVTAALSLEGVRLELNTLLESVGQPNLQIDKRKWNGIVPTLAEIISQCPVSLPTDESRLPADIRGRLQQSRSQPIRGRLVEQLMVAKVPTATFHPGADPALLTYCVVIIFNDSTKIVTPMAKS